MTLPNGRLAPQRTFEGQRFVHHRADGASWVQDQMHECDVRDSGIGEATQGVASVRVLRVGPVPDAWEHEGAFLFLMVLRGQLRLGVDEAGSRVLETDETCVLPQRARYTLEASAPCDVLEVKLPAW